MNPGRPSLLIPLLACSLLAFLPGTSTASECTPDEMRLCLQGDRFEVTVAWTDHDGQSGEGKARGITGDTGAFWFFDEDNLELMIKLLDGRPVNGRFWVFYGALSDVEYTVTVTDTATGARRTYFNPAGRLASRADTEAFADTTAPATVSARVSAASTALGGPEFQVNVHTRGVQRSPALAVDDAGNAMVVWTSDHEPPPNPLGIYGRIYDAQGNPRTGEFLVSGPGTSFASLAAVAANRAGEFLVVWDAAGSIFIRRFSGDGRPLSGAVRLNLLSTKAGPPAIARRPQGGFVVVWRDDFNGIRALVLDEQGSQVRSETAVAPEFRTGEPRLAVSSTGSFVVAWAAEQDIFEADVWVRRFGAGGNALGDAILVNGEAPFQAGYQSGAVPAFLPDGSFTVVWQTVLTVRDGHLGVFGRAYDGSGQPVTGVVELNPPGSRPHSLMPPALTADRLGRLLLLWNGDGPGDEDGLFGRFLGPALSPDGDTFLVNLFKEESQTEPAAAADPSGGFLAVWASGTDYSPILPPPGFGLSSQDGNFFGVFGRTLSAPCPADGVTLCLGGRFEVRVSWTDHDGNTGEGRPVPLAADTGAFWFFGEDNLELMVKALDGRPVNGHFWVFYGALSDVRYTLTVTDTVTGAVRTYTNPPGQLASRADTEAFPLE